MILLSPYKQRDLHVLKFGVIITFHVKIHLQNTTRERGSLSLISSLVMQPRRPYHSSNISWKPYV